MSRKPARLQKGRRELNKEDKLRRITGAARALFVTKGYDETSTREIATKADVAQATLFLYASDKRDLLFLTVNDELELASYRAREAIRSEASFLDNLSAALGIVYDFLGKERELARLVLREMTFYEDGAQGKRFSQTRQRMISLCSEIARIAQEKGEIGTAHDAQRIGAVIFGIYQIEIRKWLAEPPAPVSEGLRALREVLEILVTGLSPNSKPSRLRT
ncbi:TetR/AcrR family transcriptional regulator [Bradyrhizobium jicamae]|uniref:TetR/AcrR family transcriptional regulator n=1 Tax=Bradyrhizobium jicamae TaxID=280332 RepID=UPI001BAADA61|nr:TetR/AcrR family transcriptional regulator [Bradyrhizobium jicamae]MBR0755274.1 TetR/AcrR family transcriptional regulator [Bradyrhizobium jicamae]